MDSASRVVVIGLRKGVEVRTGEEERWSKTFSSVTQMRIGKVLTGESFGFRTSPNQQTQVEIISSSHAFIHSAATWVDKCPQGKGSSIHRTKALVETSPIGYTSRLHAFPEHTQRV